MLIDLLLTHWEPIYKTIERKTSVPDIKEYQYGMTVFFVLNVWNEVIALLA